MKKLKEKLNNEKGIAIVLTLGILSLMVILALFFVATTRVAHQVASVYDDSTQARLMAETAMNRALAICGFNGTADSGEMIDLTIEDDNADGKFDKSDKSFSRRNFMNKVMTLTDDSLTYSNDGTLWDDIIVDSVLIGRVAYAARKGGGKLNPAACIEVDDGDGYYDGIAYDAENLDTMRKGKYVSDISLIQTGVTGTALTSAGDKSRFGWSDNEFATNSVSGMTVIEEVNKIFDLEGSTPEKYWIDSDANGKKSGSEMKPRFNLARTDWGEATADKSDQMDLLKNGINWLGSWGDSEAEIRDRICANIIDYSDTDSIRTFDVSSGFYKLGYKKIFDNQEKERKYAMSTGFKKKMEYAGIENGPYINEFNIITTSTFSMIPKWTDVTSTPNTKQVFGEALKTEMEMELELVNLGDHDMSQIKVYMQILINVKSKNYKDILFGANDVTNSNCINVFNTTSVDGVTGSYFANDEKYKSLFFGPVSTYVTNAVLDPDDSGKTVGIIDGYDSGTTNSTGDVITIPTTKGYHIIKLDFTLPDATAESGDAGTNHSLIRTTAPTPYTSPHANMKTFDKEDPAVTTGLIMVESGNNNNIYASSLQIDGINILITDADDNLVDFIKLGEAKIKEQNVTPDTDLRINLGDFGSEVAPGGIGDAAGLSAKYQVKMEQNWQVKNPLINWKLDSDNVVIKNDNISKLSVKNLAPNFTQANTLGKCNYDTTNGITGDIFKNSAATKDVETTNDITKLSTNFIPNRPMESLWELGSIGRGETAKTLNIDKYYDNLASDDLDSGHRNIGGGTSGYAGGDANILDQVCLTDNTSTYGLVGLNFVLGDNKVEPEKIYDALFAGISVGTGYDMDACAIADSTTIDHVAMRNELLKVNGEFDTRAEVIRHWQTFAAAVSPLPADDAVDSLAEEYIGKFINLTSTVKSDMFLIAVGQSIKDVGAEGQIAKAYDFSGTSGTDGMGYTIPVKNNKFGPNNLVDSSKGQYADITDVKLVGFCRKGQFDFADNITGEEKIYCKLKWKDNKWIILEYHLNKGE